MRVLAKMSEQNINVVWTSDDNNADKLKSVKTFLSFTITKKLKTVT